MSLHRWHQNLRTLPRAISLQHNTTCFWSFTTCALMSTEPFAGLWPHLLNSSQHILNRKSVIFGTKTREEKEKLFSSKNVSQGKSSFLKSVFETGYIFAVSLSLFACNFDNRPRTIAWYVIFCGTAIELSLPQMCCRGRDRCHQS